MRQGIFGGRRVACPNPRINHRTDAKSNGDDDHHHHHHDLCEKNISDDEDGYNKRLKEEEEEAPPSQSVDLTLSRSESSSCHLVHDPDRDDSELRELLQAIALPDERDQQQEASPHNNSSRRRRKTILLRHLFCGKKQQRNRSNNLTMAATSSTAAEEEEDEYVDQDELVTEECPICLETMTSSDVRYPLACPSASCSFQVCLRCIRNMQKSEADGYQQASDGSQQVKFRVACPSCRAKYASPQYPNHSIVSYVVTLRQAHQATQTLFRLQDSELSATDLKQKYEFLQTKSTLTDIKDAAVNYEQYLKQVGKPQEVFVDWDLLDELFSKYAHLREYNDGDSQSSGSAANHAPRPKPWRDPTLFLGLQDCMTAAEQEFLTGLLCSGEAELLAQAAHILHGILAMTAERQAAMAVQELSSIANGPRAVASGNAPNTTRRTTTTTPPSPSLSPKEMQQLRARFPLPKHMPLCAAVPVYDPYPKPSDRSKSGGGLRGFVSRGGGGGHKTPLQFVSDDHDHADSLTLAAVRGPAGRSGLRRGDVVTHVRAEAVHDRRDLLDRHIYKAHQEYLQEEQLQQGGGGDQEQEATPSVERTVLIVVNANAETAHALQVRAELMQQEREKQRMARRRAAAAAKT